MPDPSPTVRPEPVRFGHVVSGFGLGTASPRLSRRVPVAPDRWVQSAFELELIDEAGDVVTYGGARAAGADPRRSCSGGDVSRRGGRRP